MCAACWIRHLDDEPIRALVETFGCQILTDEEIAEVVEPGPIDYLRDLLLLRSAELSECVEDLQPAFVR